MKNNQWLHAGYAHLCITASFANNDIFLYFSLVISAYCPRTDTQIAISAVVNSFMHGFTGLTSHNAECANACITHFLHIQSHASKLRHTVLNNTIANTYIAAWCCISITCICHL